MRGSVQKRGKGSWRLVFDLERGHTGRRRQRVVTFRGTKKDAELELARVIAESQNGGFTEPSILTLGDYLKRWIESRAAEVSPKTYERYSEICTNHLIPALGGIRLSKLKPLDIQSCYAEAQKTGRLDRPGGLSARTVLHHHRVLRQALKQAVQWRLIAIDPTDAVKAPKPERKDAEVLDENQTAAVLQAAEDKPLFIPILLAVTTGLRRGELLALKWRNVDLALGVLTVVETLEETKEGGLRFKTPKTEGSRRSVTLPGFTAEELKRDKVRQAEKLLGLGVRQDAETLVCGRYDGSPRSPRAFTKEFTVFMEALRAKGRVGSQIDIPRVTFHGLRHSHATQLLRSGIHPKIAQERLGHSTIAVTLDLYSHVSKSMQDEAAQQVDKALRAAINKRTSREH
jgi:integrase